VVEQSLADRSAGSVWAIPPAERAVAAMGLGASAFLAAVPSAQAAYAGLDPSWAVGLNAARGYGLRFGSDLLYTYGPLGFLDNPLTLSRGQYILGIIFAIVAVFALWVMAYLALRRLMSPRAAALLSTAVAVLFASATGPSTLLVIACAMAGLLRLSTRGDLGAMRPRIEALSVGVGSVAGLLVQIKLPAGVAALAVAVILAVADRPWRRALLNLAATSAAVLVSFLVLWRSDGQLLADLPPWLRGSLQVSAGYGEAMGYERPDGGLGYVVAGAVVVVIGVLAALAARQLPRAEGLGVVVMTATMLVFAFKTAFTRHDAHELAFFPVAGALVIVLAPFAQRRGPAFIALVAALVMVFPGLSPLDLKQTRDRWRIALQSAFSSEAAAATTTQAREAGKATYQLPQEFVDDIGSHPVAVDPWDNALPVAYQMRWAPMPVFQSYVAYTPFLDDLNAEAAREAPADQYVLRATSPGLDGRNPAWETPTYLLTLACDYTNVRADEHWTLLRHASPRCEPPDEGDPVSVEAGQVVAVPEAGPSEIVVAHFTPEPEGRVTRLVTTLLKDWSPFFVTVDGLTYRLPEALAGQPLMMAFPADGPEPVFGQFHYDNVSFSRAGTVRFDTIMMRPE
jgi:hypothetical protein